MELEIGNPLEPTGNLVVYSLVVGHNPFQDGCQILASNVFISFLFTNDNLPVVTFPPVSLKDKKELLQSLKLRNYFDLVRLEDMRFPDDPTDINKYLKVRLKAFNEVVEQYVELCTAYLNRRQDETARADEDDFDQALFDEIAGGDRTWNAATRDTDRAEGPPRTEVIPDNVPDLQAAFASQLEEIEYLEHLTLHYRKSIAGRRQTGDAAILENLQDFGAQFNLRNPQYGFVQVMKFMPMPGKPVSRIIELFFRKFRAIYHERYEEAGTITREIVTIQKKDLAPKKPVTAKAAVAPGKKSKVSKNAKAPGGAKTTVKVDGKKSTGKAIQKKNIKKKSTAN